MYNNIFVHIHDNIFIFHNFIFIKQLIKSINNQITLNTKQNKEQYLFELLSSQKVMIYFSKKLKYKTYHENISKNYIVSIILLLLKI